MRRPAVARAARLLHMMVDPQIRAELKLDPLGTLAKEFSRHRQRLYRIIDIRIDPLVATRVDPDDVLQEAWLSAAKRVDHFLDNESMSLFVWLRLIVIQTLVDVQRRHGQAKSRSIYRERSLSNTNPAVDSSAAPLSEALATWTTPSDAIVNTETSSRLREIVGGMDRIDREVLVMRHFEELSNSEVAAVLNLRETTASNRYTRALARLKALMATGDESGGTDPARLSADQSGHARPSSTDPLTDSQWGSIKDIFPIAEKRGQGRPPRDRRTMVDAILWIQDTKSPWRSLPDHFGPWETVYSLYRKWTRDGTWTRILSGLDATRGQKRL